MTTYHTARVEGLDVFYRQAGDPNKPKLLLLGGFPASSHQFRNLIPALADSFHVLSPDYPGFGNTDMPNPATWHYTFDHLAAIIDGLLAEVGFTGPMGIYLQDYGGPARPLGQPERRHAGAAGRLPAARDRQSHLHHRASGPEQDQPR